MKSRSMIRIAAAFCLALAVGAVAQAQAKKNLKDEIQQSEKAAQVFREIMDTPDNAQILSYSRSKGVFAGLELKGVVIKPDKDDMRNVYGEGVTAKEVLKENKVTAPVAARAFPTTLGRYSSRVAKK